MSIDAYTQVANDLHSIQRAKSCVLRLFWKSFNKCELACIPDPLGLNTLSVRGNPSPAQPQFLRDVPFVPAVEQSVNGGNDDQGE